MKIKSVFLIFLCLMLPLAVIQGSTATGHTVHKELHNQTASQGLAVKNNSSIMLNVTFSNGTSNLKNIYLGSLTPGSYMLPGNVTIKSSSKVPMRVYTQANGDLVSQNSTMSISNIKYTENAQLQNLEPLSKNRQIIYQNLNPSNGTLPLTMNYVITVPKGSLPGNYTVTIYYYAQAV